MEFGQKAKDIVESSGDYLRNLKAGDTKVRFHEEIPEWIGYWEHFIGKQSFPCTEDRKTCPGCTHEDEKVRKASRRYAVNLLEIDKGVVLPYRIPSTVKKRCDTRAGRNDGSITTRDYTIIKSGQMLDTEYDVEQEEEYPIDWSKHEENISDLQEILKASFEEVWGEGSAEKFAPGNATEPEKKAPRKRESVDDQIAGWEAEKTAKKAPAKKAAAKEEPEEDVVVTESDLRKMGLLELAALADKAGVDINGLKSTDEIVDALLAADEPPF
jgi:hypothetical protein